MLALSTTLGERWCAVGRPVASILMTALRFSLKGGAWFLYPALFVLVAFIAHSERPALLGGFFWFLIFQQLINAVVVQRRVGMTLVVPGHLRHVRRALLSIWAASVIPVACALGGMTSDTISLSAFALACTVWLQLRVNRIRWLLLAAVLTVFMGVFVGVFIYKFPAVVEFWCGHSGTLAVAMTWASALIIHAATGFKSLQDAKELPAQANAGLVNLRPTDERRMRKLFALNGENASPMQRLFFGMFLLETRWHDLRWSRAIIGTAAGLACYGLVIHLLTGLPSMLSYQLMIGLVLLRFLWQFVFIRSRFLWTGHEQALLVLLPGIPRGYMLSRAIAARLGLGFVRRWVMSLAALESLRLVAGIVAPGWFDIHFGFWPEALLVGTLPLLLSLWRPWGEMSTSSSRIHLVLGIVITAFAGALYGLAEWPLVAIAVGYIAATAIGCAWRWHAMAGEPAALPVGRSARGEQRAGGGGG